MTHGRVRRRIQSLGEDMPASQVRVESSGTGAVPSLWAGQVLEMEMALLRCSHRCTPHNWDPSRSLAQVLCSLGQRLPEITALPQLTFTWVVALARLGSRGGSRIHSRTLLGHQLRRLCAKLPMLRVPSILPDRACTRQTLFSAGPHIRRKKFYSITMARLAPFPKMLFCCICALPGSEEP